MPKNHANQPATYPVGLLPAVAPPEAPDPPPVAPAAKAGVAEWRSYAEALGVDTAGLTKAQIRAAV